MDRATISAGFRDFDAIRARHSKPQILVEGDSIAAAMFDVNSQSILFWSSFAHLQYDFNPTIDNFAVGGSLSDTTGITTGMLHPDRLKRCVDRCKLIKSTTGQPIAFIVDIGMNGNANTLVSDIKKWWGIVSAAGADHLIILSTQPSTGGWALNEAQAAQRIENNNRLGRWAALNASEIQFTDITQYCLKNTPNSASDMFPSLGDANETVGSTTRDGTHPCGAGSFLQAKGLMPCLANVCPAVHSRIASPYNGLSGGGGNLIGRAGRFNIGGATSAQNFVNGNLIGIENAPGDGTGAFGGFGGDLAGLTATMTRAPYTPIVRATGRTDSMALRIEFSGTTTGAASIYTGKDVNIGWDSAHPIEVEGDMYLDGLKNFRHLYVRGAAGPATIGLGNAAGNSGNSDTIFLPATGHFRPRSSFGLLGNSGSFSASIGVSFPPGVTVSGAIELYGYGGFVCPPLPAATA